MRSGPTINPRLISLRDIFVYIYRSLSPFLISSYLHPSSPISFSTTINRLSTLPNLPEIFSLDTAPSPNLLPLPTTIYYLPTTTINNMGNQSSAPKLLLAPDAPEGAKVLAHLLEENDKFTRGQTKKLQDVSSIRTHLAKEGQTPVACVIACADSRVSPEILFRAHLGEAPPAPAATPCRANWGRSSQLSPRASRRKGASRKISTQPSNIM